MKKASPSIVFAGGGTLGHLFAGLAVAEALRGFVPASFIHFAGRGFSRERIHVEAAGYGYHAIACSPWPRRPWAAGNFFFNNLCGYLEARRLLRDVRAGVVVGLGGYASAPVARAAVSLAIPLVLLEQNAVPGRVNRWLSRYAACICTSFASPPTRQSNKVYFTGNPVRCAFRATACTAGAAPAYEAGSTPALQAKADTTHVPQLVLRRERLLVVTGGSQGAAALNAAVPEAFGRCRLLVDGWSIVHQSGQREVETTRQRYRRLGIAAEVTAFADLANLLPRASLAICRAGGSTIAELCLTGTPAILCPYPHASDDHQRHNAVAVAPGCRVVEERLPDFVGKLKDELSMLLTDESRRLRMSQELFRHARPHAARDIARLVLAEVSTRDVAISGG